MQARLVRIGTRGSPLALAQARDVAARLAAAHGVLVDAIEIVVIKTSGDRIQDRPLSEVGGKGLFTKEIEEALIARHIDLAVHSMKDVATRLPDGLAIAVMLEREDPRDAFLSPHARSIGELALGAVVGTSSLRRAAQVRWTRPDLKIVSFRGNVETRLAKLAAGVADATLLAAAGLNRLGMRERATSLLEIDDFLPAVAQGAVGIEIRDGEQRMEDLLKPLSHAATEIAVEAERAFLARLDGSCRTPIAGFARIEGNELHLRGMILAPDGSRAHGVERRGAIADASAIGFDAAEDVLARAGPEFLKTLSG